MRFESKPRTAGVAWVLGIARAIAELEQPRTPLQETHAYADAVAALAEGDIGRARADADLTVALQRSIDRLP